MQVYCYYWSPNDPYSLTFIDDGEPLCSKSDAQYSDLVISYLNKDCSDIIEIEDYDCVPNEIKAMLRKSYKELFDEEMKHIDFDEIERLIKYVFLLNEVSHLTAKQKYLAYISISDFSLSYNSLAEVEAGASNRKDSNAEAWARGKNIFPNVSNDFYETFIDRCNFIEKNQLDVPFSANYSFKSVSDAFFFLLSEMIKNNCVVKICPNCNHYFVPRNRSDTIFCNNISPQDETKTCAEYGKYQNWLRKTHTDEATKLYRQIYNQKRNKYIRSITEFSPKGKTSLSKDLDKFVEGAIQWKDDVKAGMRVEAEYIEWLLKFKKKGGSINGNSKEKNP